MFSPISRSEALQIAFHALVNRTSVPLVYYATQPSTCRIYHTQSEPCWYIYVPWHDDNDVIAIRSSRVMLVGKLTGASHYDGSAGDEG